jgi:hypothetical protein
MKRNQDRAFVGIAELKRKHAEQLAQFREWESTNNWQALHKAHYDWWMFPVDEPSSYGFAWTVYEGDIAELKQDDVYMKGYEIGVEILARSWGWNIHTAKYLADLHYDQCWQNWPIRLYKCAKSLLLFGYQPQFNSMRIYARDLMRQGHSFAYSRDITSLFK